MKLDPSIIETLKLDARFKVVNWNILKL
jgi:hypothetical protein